MGTTTRPPDQLARAIASAVCACPGVAGLDAGSGRRTPGPLPVPGQRACQSRKIRLALPLQTLARTVSPIGAEPMKSAATCESS